MKTVKNLRGNDIPYLAAVTLMDFDLREAIHGDLAPCTEQEFFDEYAKRHLEKFMQDFHPYAGNNW